MSSTCPNAETLFGWLDDEIPPTESQMVRAHLESCEPCRQHLLQWVEAVRNSPRSTARPSEPSPSCLDAEALVAYCENELDPARATWAEEHLHACRACAGEVQRLVALRVAMAPTSIAQGSALHSPGGAAEQPEAVVLGRSASASEGTMSPVRSWVRAIAERAFHPWPMAGAVAAAALLVITIGQLRGPESIDVHFRGGGELAQVTIVADSVDARARPGEEEPVVAHIVRGTVAVLMEESGVWARLRLADGRRVWVRRAEIVVARE